MNFNFIYCRGGDKLAPKIASQAGMKYGVRYDYTAYADVYMLDAGLNPRWPTYIKRVRRLRPQFALAPDFEQHRDRQTMELYISDLRREKVPLIGCAPKFYGALGQLPEDIIICISIPTQYSGYLPADEELLPDRKYHLLGGDIRSQINEMRRIIEAGGEVISMDGSKLAMKAAHGQIWTGEKWETVKGNTTHLNAQISAKNIMATLRRFHVLPNKRITRIATAAVIEDTAPTK